MVPRLQDKIILSLILVYFVFSNDCVTCNKRNIDHDCSARIQDKMMKCANMVTAGFCSLNATLTFWGGSFENSRLHRKESQAQPMSIVSVCETAGIVKSHMVNFFYIKHEH